MASLHSKKLNSIRLFSTMRASSSSGWTFGTEGMMRRVGSVVQEGNYRWKCSVLVWYSMAKNMPWFKTSKTRGRKRFSITSENPKPQEWLSYWPTISLQIYLSWLKDSLLHDMQTIEGVDHKKHMSLVIFMCTKELCGASTLAQKCESFTSTKKCHWL